MKMLAYVMLFAAFLLLMSCATVKNNAPIKITTSKTNLLYASRLPAELFDTLSRRIVSETQAKLQSDGIVVSTSEKDNFDTLILLIDYDSFEDSSWGNKTIFTMKGKLSLTNPKNKQLIFSEKFDEAMDVISDFPEPMSKLISNKVSLHF